MMVIIVFTGDKVHDLLQSKRVDSEYINSGTGNQNLVAKKWNDDSLRVLITTTLGLVGNESSRTQLVCIVGLLYNLPSIVQAYGRIRPKRRTNYSQCSIYTMKNNYGRVNALRSETLNGWNQLHECKIVSVGQFSTYKNSLTIGSVNDWLFLDQGCRHTSLAQRLGYKCLKCGICDKCTDTEVRALAIGKRMESDENKKRKEAGILLLERLKRSCMCCNRKECDGTCVARKNGSMTCYHCLGRHYARDCPKEYKNILRGKACFSCYMYNYSKDCSHDIKDCSGEGGMKERLRGLIQHDYLKKKKNPRISRGFEEHLSGIFASEGTFFDFLYKYRDWK